MCVYEVSVPAAMQVTSLSTGSWEYGVTKTQTQLQLGQRCVQTLAHVVTVLIEHFTGHEACNCSSDLLSGAISLVSVRRHRCCITLNVTIGFGDTQGAQQSLLLAAYR